MVPGGTAGKVVAGVAVVGVAAVGVRALVRRKRGQRPFDLPRLPPGRFTGGGLEELEPPREELEELEPLRPPVAPRPPREELEGIEELEPPKGRRKGKRGTPGDALARIVAKRGGQ